MPSMALPPAQNTKGTGRAMRPVQAGSPIGLLLSEPCGARLLSALLLHQVRQFGLDLGVGRKVGTMPKVQVPCVSATAGVSCWARILSARMSSRPEAANARVTAVPER